MQPGLAAAELVVAGGGGEGVDVQLQANALNIHVIDADHSRVVDGHPPRHVASLEGLAAAVGGQTGKKESFYSGTHERMDEWKVNEFTADLGAQAARNKGRLAKQVFRCVEVDCDLIHSGMECSVQGGATPRQGRMRRV